VPVLEELELDEPCVVVVAAAAVESCNEYCGAGAGTRHGGSAAVGAAVDDDA